MDRRSRSRQGTFQLMDLSHIQSQEREQSPDRRDREPNTNVFKASVNKPTTPKFTYLEYPGHVVNYDNAIRTLGGIGKISDVFSCNAPKLDLKFRPNDPYCNSVSADGTKTCGFLINIRTRKKDREKIEQKDSQKNKQLLQENTIDFTKIGPPQMNPLIPTTDPDLTISLDEIIPGLFGKGHENELLTQITTESEEEISRKLANLDSFYTEKIKKSSATTIDNIITRNDPPKQFVHIPIKDKKKRKLQENQEVEKSDIKIDILGFVEQKYTFGNGQVCDFQYLPSKLTKGKHVSILSKILPIFTDPEKDPQFICELGDAEDAKIPLFLTPMFISRIDKPLSLQTHIAEEAQEALAAENNSNLVEPKPSTSSSASSSVQANADSDFVVVPIRSKRVIFSHMVDFRITDDQFILRPDEAYVPTKPMPGAREGIKSIDDEIEKLLVKLKTLFEKRPIWSKQALEFETQKPHIRLKQLVPLFAYFALNGPWRSLWVKFGYDPRRSREAFEYQTLDYRIPNTYRNFLVFASYFQEAHCFYKSHMIPPKCQMFYQLCDVQIKEVDEIRKIYRRRLGLDNSGTAEIPSNTDIKYSPKFGFMNEESLEFCRYNISRYIEFNLKAEGKISSITLPPIELSPGGIVPREKLKIGSSPFKTRHRRYRNKPRDPFTIPRRRGRRNSGSSSVVDLEIDRDEIEHEIRQQIEAIGHTATAGAGGEGEEFDDEYDSDNENPEEVWTDSGSEEDEEDEEEDEYFQAE